MTYCGRNSVSGSKKIGASLIGHSSIQHRPIKNITQTQSKSIINSKLYTGPV